MQTWIVAHPVEALLYFWLFSNLVGAMPKPRHEDRWYCFLYRAAHGFAGNVRYAIQSRFGDAFVQSDNPKEQ